MPAVPQTFDDLFRIAFDRQITPFDYQRRLACGERDGRDESSWLTSGTNCESKLIDIPTGCGKTAAVVLAWLWNRVVLPSLNSENFRGSNSQPPVTRKSDEGGSTINSPDWPRRLVFCLPMRTLVEQTEKNVRDWLRNLDDREWDGKPNTHDGKVGLHILMGGEEKTDWDLYPERDAILIGTQDMLLSRALNRGYGMSRYRWPMHLGLLNNDCLWVLDEIQLMGPGLATACQLEAFRSQSPGSSGNNLTWYVSATARRAMVVTRDWRDGTSDKRPPKELFEFGLLRKEKEDLKSPCGQRRAAIKDLTCQLDWHFSQEATLQRILKEHRQMLAALHDAPSELPRRTLLICNTVKRAKMLFAALRHQCDSSTELILLHSRFRRPDRNTQMRRLKDTADAAGGQIVIATQVIEAGVDISSGILWTEDALLASLIQRLGRLNRYAEFGYHGAPGSPIWRPLAFIIGFDFEPIPQGEKPKAAEEREAHNTKLFLPYERKLCEEAFDAFASINDASPANLETALDAALTATLQPAPYSLQRHELLDLFDTDSNLSLGYTDVSPFVRGTDPETDVLVLWRDWNDGDFPPQRVQGLEVCQVPFWEAKWNGKEPTSWRKGFIWQGKELGWQRADDRNFFPGATLLLPVSAGGYREDEGWTGKPEDKAITDLYDWPTLPTDEELRSGLAKGWQSIGEHTGVVEQQLTAILDGLGIPSDDPLRAALMEVVLWHDFGKRHEDWQKAVEKFAAKEGVVCPEEHRPFGKFSVAESPRFKLLTGRELQKAIWSLRYAFRPGLAHEVASSLALRQNHHYDGQKPEILELLAEFIVMAHHGHVRKTLRDELPKKPRSNAGQSVEEVRGICDGVVIEEVAVGETVLQAGPLRIECRQMGRGADGSESWTRGVLRLLDHFGPFKLAFYETLLRAADQRASSLPTE